MAKQQTTSLATRAKSIGIEPTSVYMTHIDPRTTGYLQFISKAALKQGVHVMGGPGAGKSTLLGRVFPFMTLAQKKSLVMIDPTGGAIDQLFDRIIRLPFALQQEVWKRILYIDAGAKDYVVPTPLYYRQSKPDTLFEIANRLPSIFERQDRALANAPILGLNVLIECAINVGKIAVALGRQIDFVADLIDHPGKYKAQLRQVLVEYPELHPEVTYFRELMDPKSSGLREKRTGSFRNKLIPFLADPTMLATFASHTRKLDWEKLIRQQKTVLIDLRNEWDPNRRQFKMLWYFKGFTDYIKHRGMAGRGQEVMLIIDEITAMLGQRTRDGSSILAEDLEELTAVLGRNFGVNVVLAHQNLSQVDERIQNVLMQMGNQIIGVTPNPDDALRIARQFLQYDPYLVKKTENIWMSVTEPPLVQFMNGHWGPVPTMIDQRTVEFTPQEQVLLFADKLRNLGRFRFYSKIATGEGDLRGTVNRISIARLDQNQYPNEQILAPLRQQLTERDGIAVSKLLDELRARASEWETQKQTPPKKSARLNTSSSPPYAPADTPKPDTDAPVRPASPPTGGVDEDPWQA